MVEHCIYLVIDVSNQTLSHFVTDTPGYPIFSQLDGFWNDSPGMLVYNYE